MRESGREPMMTREELEQILPLHSEIRMQKKRIERLRRQQERLCLIAAHETGGDPFALSIQSEARRCAQELRQLRGSLLRSALACAVRQRRAAAFIQAAPDSELRQILSLRYLDGRTWLQVALAIGGDCTEDGVRMRLSRFWRSVRRAEAKKVA